MHDWWLFSGLYFWLVTRTAKIIYIAHTVKIGNVLCIFLSVLKWRIMNDRYNSMKNDRNTSNNILEQISLLFLVKFLVRKIIFSIAVFTIQEMLHNDFGLTMNWNYVLTMVQGFAIKMRSPFFTVGIFLLQNFLVLQKKQKIEIQHIASRGIFK